MPAVPQMKFPRPGIFSYHFQVQPAPGPAGNPIEVLSASESWGFGPLPT